MPCPYFHAADLAEAAVAHCPFLAEVGRTQGVEYAKKLAISPTVPVRKPLLEVDEYAFVLSLRSFHGPEGVVPLKKFECLGVSQRITSTDTALTCSQPCSSAAPFASISFSGGVGPLPGPSELLRLIKSKLKGTPKPQQPGSSGTSSSSYKAASQPGPGRGLRVSNAKPPAASLAAPSATGGRCPMRKFIEPLGGLIPLGSAMLGRLQHMKCPSAIVKARAFVAKTQPVRQLRPQSLLVKMAAIGAFAGLLNLPFGAWREHTRKFSPAWFAAVHAPIPLIAILRKAVIMPKWAMLLTFTSAIVGQAVGARLERSRVDGHLQLPTLSLAVPLPTVSLQAAGGVVKGGMHGLTQALCPAMWERQYLAEQQAEGQWLGHVPLQHPGQSRAGGARHRGSAAGIHNGACCKAQTVLSSPDAQGIAVQ